MNLIPAFCARALLVGALLALSAPTSVRAQSVTYTIQDLGSFGGIKTVANGLNNFGQVVGYSKKPGDGYGHSFLYSNGRMIELATLGGPGGGATSINNAGQIVGMASVVGLYFRGFFYSDGKLTEFGTVAGRDSSPSRINDARQIVGGALVTARDEPMHAFLYSAGKMTGLGGLGGSYSQALGLNNRGQVVGQSTTAAVHSPEGNYNYEPNHAFLYSDGVMTDLGTFGGHDSRASAINDAGQIVGDANIPGGRTHAFLFSNGKMTDLGTLGGAYSVALGINNAGKIVGNAYTLNRVYNRAFLFSSGRMTDLNTVLPKGSGWVLETATGINEAGQIIGNGMHNGVMRAFLLTPVSASAPRVTDFRLSPPSVPVAGKSTITVRLSGPAGAGGITVFILYRNLTLATVSIAPGSAIGATTLTATRPGVFTLNARLGSGTTDALWTVTPRP